MNIKRVILLIVGVLLIILLSFPCKRESIAYAASKGAAPVAHWRFDEGGGPTAYDDSANNNDGTMTPGAGGTNTAAGQMWSRQGKIGGAGEFDGTDDYVSVPDSSTWKGVDITISAWIKPSAWVDNESGNSSHWIYPAGDGFGIVSSASNWSWWIYTTARQVRSTSHNNALNQWSHLVLTYNKTSGDMKFYLNGALKDTYNLGAGTAMNIGTGAFQMGSTSSGLYSGNGFMDDVKVYDYARTPAQVMVDYNAGAAVYTGAGTDPNEGNPPVLYYNFDEASGTTAYDRSGNNNNASTFAGSPSWVAGKYGNCLKFPTDNDYAYAPPSSTINLGASDFSVASWVNVPKPVTFGSGLFGRYAHNTSYNGCFVVGILDNLTSLFFHHRNAAGTLNSWTYDYSPYFGRWVHVVWIKTASKIYLYLDGELKQEWTHSVTFDVDFTGWNYMISNTGWSPGTMSNLMVDEHKVYNYARTAAQVAYDYNKGKPIAHYKFDEGTGPIALNAYSSAGSGGDDPVGWWRMDNDWTDASGNGNNGTGGGAITFSSSSKIGPYCGNFDGNDDNVIKNPVSNFPTTAITAEFWMKSSDATKTGTPISYASSGAGGDNTFLLYNYNALSIYIAGASVGTGVALNDGNWNHIAVTWQNSDGAAKLYKNGTLAYSGTLSSGATITQGGSFVIGQEQDSLGGGFDPSQAFLGLIDDVRIYDYARTAEQIYNDYKTTHGTMVGDTKFVDGKIGKALYFDGSGDYVDCGTDSSFGVEQLTLEAWVKLANYSGYHAPVGLGVVGGSGQEIDIDIYNSNGYFYSHHSNTGSLEVNSNTAVPLDTWTHLAVTYDGTYQKLYMNGASVGSWNIGLPLNLGSNPKLTIGRNPERAEQFPGYIDDVRIYNYARTAGQVMQDYNAGLDMHAGVATGVADPWGGALPVGHWKLDENTGVLARDTSENNIDGTVSGATWVQGKLGSGLSFDNNDDYLLLPSTIYLDDTANWSVSAWVKPGDSGINSVLSNSSGGPVSNDLRVNNSKICYYHYDGAWQAKYGTTDIVDGNWHFLTWVNHSNQTIDLYVDGVLEADGVASVLTNNGPVNQIGRNWSETANASIDDVRVYGYAMTQAQVAWDYNKGKPVAHWRMDEATSGAANGQTIYDDSDNDNDGTANYGANTTGMTWTTGKYGGALSFDGVDDYMSVTDPSTMDSLSAITVGAWVKPTAYTGDNAIVSKFVDPSQRTFYLMIQSSGTVRFILSSDGTNYIGDLLTTDTVSTGSWSHIIGTYDGSTAKVYINGVEVKSAAVSGNLFNSTANVNFGAAYNGTGGFYNGLIDDARIYNYARTAAQVMQDYNQGLSTKLGD